MSQIFIEGHPSTGRPGHPFSLMKQHLAMARSPGFGSDGRYYHRPSLGPVGLKGQEVAFARAITMHPPSSCCNYSDTFISV